MTTIIDRRLNPRDKNAMNRQRFIARNKKQIKDSIRDIMKDSNIGDIDKVVKRIKVKGTDEPVFQQNPKSGNRKYILPGNDEFVTNDKLRKPSNESEGMGRKAGAGPDGEDEFEFLLSYDEFMSFIFDEFELPDFVKKQLKDTKSLQLKRAGYKAFGNPAQLDLIRSAKNALGRRIGLQRPSNDYIEQLEAQLEYDKERGVSKDILAYLEEQIEEAKRKQILIPWIDPFDVRYRNYQQVPMPVTKAVMFCLMDISASMQEREKEICKKFFLLLNLFLKRKYEKVDVVFVAHTTIAEEVSEHEFFYSKTTGGTLVSSALELTKKIIKERYNPTDWNIYVAQGSDGDNIEQDNQLCIELLQELLVYAQYYAYIEVTPPHSPMYRSSLWRVYEEVTGKNKKLQAQGVNDTKEVWRVFAELFAKNKKD